jgi:hypothetical protein
MKMNIVGQSYMYRKRQAEVIAKAKRRLLNRSKQTAEERDAKITACKVKQYRKSVSRYNSYSRCMMLNPIQRNLSFVNPVNA